MEGDDEQARRQHALHRLGREPVRTAAEAERGAVVEWGEIFDIVDENSKKERTWEKRVCGRSCGSYCWCYAVRVCCLRLVFSAAYDWTDTVLGFSGCVDVR